MDTIERERDTWVRCGRGSGMVMIRGRGRVRVGVRD